MKFYFEQYHYPYTGKKPIVDDLYLSNAKDGWVINCVGYFYNVDIKEPVFVLPKVFVDAYGKAFDKFSPSEITDWDQLTAAKYQEDKNAIVATSMWLYQAIAKYARENPDQTIADKNNIQNVLAEGGDSGSSFLDKVISLVEFGRKHKTLFTYISKILHSGYNKIDWRKTISTEQPLFHSTTPYYLQFRNKKKVINYDEELIVLFLSTLSYLNKEYCLREDISPGYNLLPANVIHSLIENGTASRRLVSIRHNYFTDELVSLWNLLYAFYNHSEKIVSHSCHSETLIVRNFNIVFESMIDKLIGQDILNHLRKQQDGKIVDHIYKAKSIFEIDNANIYCIGDSKYYKESSEIVGTSKYKQFTYAKNVIQYNLDLFHFETEMASRQSWLQDFRYRDDLTEGYDVTPNFFIRGKFFSGCYDFNKERLEATDEKKIINVHFKNRLFDRDTLILKSYNINFLFVLSSYVRGVDETVKSRIRKQFRRDFVFDLKDKYNFYALFTFPGETLINVIEKNFYWLQGKVYHPRGKQFLILALENSPEFGLDNEIFLSKVHRTFNCYEYDLECDVEIETGNQLLASEGAKPFNEDIYWIKPYSDELHRPTAGQSVQFETGPLEIDKSRVCYVVMYNRQFPSSYMVHKVQWNTADNVFITEGNVELPNLHLNDLIEANGIECFLKKSEFIQYV